MKKYGIFLVLGLILGVFLVSTMGLAEMKMAVIFPGSIQDADYNTIGYIAMEEVGKKFGIKPAYSQKVAVPDAQRVLEEYINDGYNLIWAHGAQFNGAVFRIVEKYPDVTFIIEGDAPLKKKYPNVYMLGRDYYKGFYVLGLVAALKTKTNNIGYIGGLELPFTYGEMNAVYQALQKYNPKAKLHYIYVGDFNDPLKTRQAAEALMRKGCDVLLSAVNLGNFGLYNALKKAKKPVFFTGTYTSKKKYAPKHYLTSDLFNFVPPMVKAIENIKKGVRSGYFPMEFGENKGRFVEFPVNNVPDSVNNIAKEVANKIASGDIVVEKNLKTLMFEKK